MKSGLPALGLLAVVGLSSCATKDYVHEVVEGRVAPVDSQVKSLDARVGGTEAGLRDAAGNMGSLDNRLGGLDGRLSAAERALRDQDGRLGEASSTAREALDRALAAGKLAQGKFVHEVVMSGTTLAFELEGNRLSDATRSALDDFAAGLKRDNRNVYVEIQGHTDTTGSEAYNLRLGQERAEAVRRYLNMQAGIPLHRMSVISYGESAPVADNKTREGRIQNRRVVLVVLE